MKLQTKKIIGLTALAVGVLVVDKIVRDVKKICAMANEQEELTVAVDEEIEATEETAAEAIEDAPVVEEVVIEEGTPVAEETDFAE